MGKPPVVCIVGPTACYKTAVSIALAKRFSGEIISADSVQCYLGMDIGSAKPTHEEMDGIPHHMIDCLPIDTPDFSVQKFREMALSAIHDTLARNHLPIIVGGSGLYVNALTAPLNFAIPSDVTVRGNLARQYDKDPEETYRYLQQVDPSTAERLHLHDKKRIVRALEVYACSGKPLSAFGNDFAGCSDNMEGLEYRPVMIGLFMEREALYRRIDLRVDKMMEQGLLEEAKRIHAAGYPPSAPAMQSIGYRQLFRYFDGECSLEEAVECIKRDTRRFAKRQLTWFRRDSRIEHWFDMTDGMEPMMDGIERRIREGLQ